MNTFPAAWISCLLMVLNLPFYGQVHFSQVKAIVYRSLPARESFLFEDSTRSYLLKTGNLQGWKGMRLELREMKNTDSTLVFIYRNGREIQKLVLPFPLPLMPPAVQAADINHDGRMDLKWVFPGGGNGLAALLSTKLYLFPRATEVKALSFFDFASGPEYDLNADHCFEILGCHFKSYGGHSYLVYNLYNYRDGRLQNVSLSYGYPLWTRFLEHSFSKVARDIPWSLRRREWRALPDSCHLFP